MTRIATLLLSLAVVACAPPVPEPRPNSSEGTSYHRAGGTTVMTCNTWGFDTICRASSGR
jgi:hypothetical protein